MNKGCREVAESGTQNSEQQEEAEGGRATEGGLAVAVHSPRWVPASEMFVRTRTRSSRKVSLIIVGEWPPVTLSHPSFLTREPKARRGRCRPGSTHSALVGGPPRVGPAGQAPLCAPGRKPLRSAAWLREEE